MKILFRICLINTLLGIIVQLLNWQWISFIIIPSLILSLAFVWSLKKAIDKHSE